MPWYRTKTLSEEKLDPRGGCCVETNLVFFNLESLQTIIQYQNIQVKRFLAQITIIRIVTDVD